MHLIRHPFGLTVMTASLLFCTTQQSFAQIAITGGSFNATASGTIFAPSQPNGSPIVNVQSMTVNSFALNTPQGNFSSTAGNQFNTTNFNGTASVIPNTSSARLSGQLQGTFSGTAFGPSGSPIMFSNIPSTMTGSVVVTANGPVGTTGSFAFATGNGNGEISGGTINTSGTPIQPGLSDSQLSFSAPSNSSSNSSESRIGIPISGETVKISTGTAILRDDGSTQVETPIFGISRDGQIIGNANRFPSSTKVETTAIPRDDGSPIGAGTLDSKIIFEAPVELTGTVPFTIRTLEGPTVTGTVPFTIRRLEGSTGTVERTGVVTQSRNDKPPSNVTRINTGTQIVTETNGYFSDSISSPFSPDPLISSILPAPSMKQ